MSPRPLLRAAAFLIVLSPGLAWSQNQDRRQGGAERQNLSLDGVLQGVQQGLLQVVSDGGEPWLVKVEAKPDDILYTATAQPNWLQPGMFVQFKAMFDKRGVATAPVSQLVVFTPKADTQLGALPEAGNSLAGDLFADTKTELQNKPKPKGPPEPVALTVAGRLAGVENGKLRVAAGNAVVEAALAENASISVELSNIAMARQGDKVSANGWYVQKGQGLANRLVVRAAQPLAAPKKERVIVSPEDRKKALDVLDDLSAGDSPQKDDGAKKEEPKKE